MYMYMYMYLKIDVVTIDILHGYIDGTVCPVTLNMERREVESEQQGDVSVCVCVCVCDPYLGWREAMQCAPHSL